MFYVCDTKRNERNVAGLMKYKYNSRSVDLIVDERDKCVPVGKWLF